MEKRPPRPMTPLDLLVSSDQLQMVKLMLPYLPAACRGMLAITIKWHEFQNTLRLFENGAQPFHQMGSTENNPSPFSLIEELRPFMDPQDMSSVDMLLQALNMMEMMQGMDMPGFSDMGSEDGQSNMMDLLNNLMKGSQQDE